ncbi:HEPN domain-containing protein [Rhizobium phaseoli]|uniref:HEPN domain-containing protein n=1 Tax=Rhizobium phaseoli TaxID=396 RepID=UPI0007EB1B05|nr:HEPN domain-containing protein [Rhizobium phaseoli]ANL40410.1 hypothetical protein AMC88_CH02020 [Rhizobium phaseoli]ANL59398.1 hypothetical protein AMC85_CH02019 [Rhizobium phaseoli]
MGDDTHLTKEESAAVTDAFLNAFLDLYPIAAQKAKRALTNVHNYPNMSIRDNGLPYFTSVWRNNARPDYEYALSGGSLLSPTLGALDEGNNLEPVKNLGKILWDIPAFRKRLGEENIWYAEYEATKLIEQALLRYFNCYGVSDELDTDRGFIVVRPFLFAITADRLPLALVVPILMHSFETDHYRLTDDSYVFKMRKPFQLARSVSGDSTGGVSRSVASSATHAFVSMNWNIRAQASSGLARSLTDASEPAFGEIDSFFAALRLATNAVAGYAQILQVPRGWGVSYRWDLPAMYVSEHRRYPMFYDRAYSQNDALRSVPKELMSDIRETYHQVLASKSNKMQLALRRLNACVTRDDDIDAILDAIIGIELLLGDGNDSLNFKLRMRVAGLSKLTGGRFPPENSYKEMGKLYETRSAIVHGSSRGKKSKDVEADRKTVYASQRDLATRYLRMVIKTLLEHPQYLDPSLIDKKLLISFETADEAPAQKDIPGLET